MEKEKMFWIAESLDKEGIKFKAVIGEPLNKYGIRMFVSKIGDSVRISSADCGVMLVSAKNKSAALKKLKTFVDKTGVEKIEQQIFDICENYGYSPCASLEK